MSDQDDAPAARGGSGNRVRHTAARADESGQRPWRKSEFPSDESAFARCRVKSHKDFPRHIYRLFLILGIQFRRVLTRGTLARALVSSAELAIDDPKEQTWMAMYEHDRVTLEDILYRLLQDLWAPLTDSIQVSTPTALPSRSVPRRYGKPFLLLSLWTTRACRLFCLLVKLLA